MRKLLPWLLLACLAALPPALPADTIVEEIIARINNQIVTRTEYLRSKDQLKQEAQQQDPGNADKIVAEKDKDVLRDLIDQQLLLEKGKDLGITADTEVIKRLDEMRKEMKLESMEEEIRLSELLISTEKKGKDASADETQQLAAAQAKADDVLAQIRKGAAFDGLAKKNSDGPTAAQGGDLGYFKRGTLAKELEDKTFAMKPGEVSDVIRTKQGFVVLKVTEHQQAGVPPLSQIEPRVQDAIYMQKLQPALRAYLQKLREEAYIDIKPGYVDTGASPNQTKPVETTAKDAGAKELKKKKKKLGII